MILWYALVEWMVCGKQGIEEAVKFSQAYETDIANFYRPILFTWIWVPKGMSICWKHGCKLLSKDVAVVHRDQLKTL
jgi:hypothetical protein